MKNIKYMVFISIIFLIFPFSGCKSRTTVEEGSKTVHRTIKSKIIKADMNLEIYLPRGYNLGEKYPVLYTLHGASSGETQWIEELGAGKCADKLISQNSIRPLIIVSTQTLNSVTLADSKSHKNSTPEKDLFEEYVCKELVPYIDSNYKTIRSNKSRYIGGISMGGFIALQIALHNPQLFGKAGGHSPASWIADYSKASFDQWLYSGKIIKPDEDPRETARQKGLSGLKVFLDSGESDFGIVDDTKKIYDALILRGIDAKISIGEGNHSPEYWQSNMEKYLEFYSG